MASEKEDEEVEEVEARGKNRHQRLFDESQYDDVDDDVQREGEQHHQREDERRGGSVLSGSMRSSDEEDEEHQSRGSRDDEESSSCSVSWCVLIPVAAVVTFTVFVTLIAQMGVFVGLRVVFPHGVVISPYPPETTDALLDNYNDHSLHTPAKYVAPIVTHLLNSKTLPLGLNASSHDLIVSCGSTTTPTYFCPKYYRCVVSDSRCVIDLPSSRPPTHPSPDVRLCEATISELVTADYDDMNTYGLPGIYELKDSSFNSFYLLCFLLMSLFSMVSIVVLMQDIRQHEEDEEEFEERIVSLVVVSKRFNHRLIASDNVRSRQKLQLVMLCLGVFLVFSIGYNTT